VGVVRASARAEADGGCVVAARAGSMMDDERVRGCARAVVCVERASDYV
jgi:hypothetical protein